MLGIVGQTKGAAVTGRDGTWVTHSSQVTRRDGTWVTQLLLVTESVCERVARKIKQKTSFFHVWNEKIADRVAT